MSSSIHKTINLGIWNTFFFTSPKYNTIEQSTFFKAVFHNLLFSWNIQETGEMTSSLKWDMSEQIYSADVPTNMAVSVWTCIEFLNPLLEAGHLWFVYFAAWPVGLLGIWLVLGLPHSLSWQPPTKTQTEALSSLLLRPEENEPGLSGVVCTNLSLTMHAYLCMRVFLFTCGQVYVGCKYVFFTCRGSVWSEGSV